MRQRKIKNEEEKLAALSGWLAENPESLRGQWHARFGNDLPIHLELGCGKGQFALMMASQHPECNFIAVEGQGSVILRALEKSSRLGLPNIVFVHAFIRDIETCFAAGELSGLYLNFSDPWPKDRHAKRRLTHAEYLDGYKRVLKPGSAIELRTDNADLYRFSLEEFTVSGLAIADAVEDLHAARHAAREATTEYEDKFVREGRQIHYCKALIP